MGRRKSFVSDDSIEILNEQNEEDRDICGFTETADVSGTPVASFNFRQDTDAVKVKVTELLAPSMPEAKALTDNKSAICDKLIIFSSFIKSNSSRFI